MKKETPTTVLPIDKKIEVKLMPPAGEKASMIVTIGKTNGNLDSERSLLFSLVQDRVDNLLPNAVEDAPSYQPLDLDHPAEKPSFHMVPPYYPGMGTYFILTDSSLVRKSSKELGPDEYLYIAEYVGLYKDGCVVYASLLTDDTNSDSFKQMLDMLTSINPQFK
jgi:hypothetical protein